MTDQEAIEHMRRMFATMGATEFQSLDAVAMRIALSALEWCVEHREAFRQAALAQRAKGGGA